MLQIRDWEIVTGPPSKAETREHKRWCESETHTWVHWHRRTPNPIASDWAAFSELPIEQPVGGSSCQVPPFLPEEQPLKPSRIPLRPSRKPSVLQDQTTKSSSTFLLLFETGLPDRN